MQAEIRTPAVHQEKLTKVMLSILTERGLSNEQVDGGIASRTIGFSYPTMADVFADPSKLMFDHFAIFCTVVGWDYCEVVNRVGFSPNEQEVYRRWTLAY